MINFFKNIFYREEKKVDKVTVDPKIYKTLTKNQLVKELWSRGIEHNKRQNKQELITLLIEDDKKKFK